jgi:hypothetical protein
MVELTTVAVVAIHLVAIGLASTLNPFGIAAGAALTHPEQTGGIAYEFVKNNIKSVLKGLTNKSEEDLLDPEEAHRISEAMKTLGRVQSGARRGTSFFVQPPAPFSDHYTAVYAEMQMPMSTPGVVDNNLVLPTVMPGNMNLNINNSADKEAPLETKVEAPLETKVEDKGKGKLETKVEDKSKKDG